MSKYTTEIRFLCENLAGLTESVGFSGIDNVLNEAAPKIFDFDYPIWDNDYKLVLEKKILRHYYTREICEETYGLWKLRLEDMMNIIMPFYNELYRTTTFEFNPLYDVDYRREHEGENNSEAKTSEGQREEQTHTYIHLRETDTDNTHVIEDAGTSDNTRTNVGDSWKLYNDTPQGGIQGIQDIYADVSTPALANMGYLTSAENDKENTTTIDDGETTNKREIHEQDDIDTKDTHNETNINQGTRNATHTISDTNGFVEHVYGKMNPVNYGKVISEYRKSLINIDERVINELEPLFFGLW